MTSMNIDTIIFDNDGVLVDTMSFYLDLCTRYLTSLGVTPEPGLDAKCLTMSMLESSGYMQKRYNLPYTHEEVLGHLRDMAYAFYKEKAPLKPGVAETLEELNRRGYRCMVATAGERLPAECAYKRLGIDKFLCAIHTCTEYRHSKSETEFYRLLLENVRRSPQQCLIVEDSPHAITTAMKAGLPVYAVFDPCSAAYWEETKARVWHASEELDGILQHLPDLTGK